VGVRGAAQSGREGGGRVRRRSWGPSRHAHGEGRRCVEGGWTCLERGRVERHSGESTFGSEGAGWARIRARARSDSARRRRWEGRGISERALGGARREGGGNWRTVSVKKLASVASQMPTLRSPMSLMAGRSGGAGVTIAAGPPAGWRPAWMVRGGEWGTSGGDPRESCSAAVEGGAVAGGGPQARARAGAGM